MLFNQISHNDRTIQCSFCLCSVNSITLDHSRKTYNAYPLSKKLTTQCCCSNVTLMVKSLYTSPNNCPHTRKVKHLITVPRCQLEVTDRCCFADATPYKTTYLISAKNWYHYKSSGTWLRKIEQHRMKLCQNYDPMPPNSFTAVGSNKSGLSSTRCIRIL